MKLKYLQENQLFELVGGSRKSKASLFVVFVVVVVAAARLELRSPRFKVISRVFGGIWKDTFNLQSFSNCSFNSSKELTIMEQRTLAQLLRVVLVVVVLLELRLLDCHMLVLGCI